MKTILMMTVSVLMFNSTSFGQAMQSVDIVAHMDVLDQAATFLPTGEHLGRSGAMALFPNCTAMVAPTNDEGGGLIASIDDTGLFDLLGSKTQNLASMSVYLKDAYTDDTKVTETEAIIGYKVFKAGEVNKTLKIKKINNSQASITIVESLNGKEIRSTSCRVKVK